MYFELTDAIQPLCSSWFRSESWANPTIFSIDVLQRSQKCFVDSEWEVFGWKDSLNQRCYIVEHCIIQFDSLNFIKVFHTDRVFASESRTEPLQITLGIDKLGATLVLEGVVGNIVPFWETSHRKVIETKHKFISSSRLLAKPSTKYISWAWRELYKNFLSKPTPL